MKTTRFIRQVAITLLVALVPTALAWGQGITVSEDTQSTYVPTTIINGSFDDEPWMVFTYNNVTYNTCPDPTNIDTTSQDNENGYAQNVVFNGVDGGWNTTDRTIWRSSLFEYTNSTNGLHNYQHNSSIPRTDKYVEMNNYHSCMLYQDLTTYGHDVIRWTLEHAVTTAGDEYQPIRVEIGAPNRDVNGDIINASGWSNDLNPQINPSTKAIFRYNGVTDKDGNASTIGFGSETDLQYLRLHNVDADQRSGWWTARGVYSIPEGQTVTRFGFISEAAKQNQGNLLDGITFSTLIGNLSAQQLENEDVELKGYWGETDTSKKLRVVLGSSTYNIDMTSVIGKNFRILIPAEIVGTATSVSVYHQDHAEATVSIVCTPAWTLTIPVTSATILGETKYVASFYNSSLIYQVPAGALAYTAGKVGDKVVFYRIGTNSNVIPAGTAVIIIAESSAVSNGTLTLQRLASTDVSVASNLLTGSDTEIAKPSGTVYVMGKDNGGLLGFYPLTGYTIPAGKAYYVVN